MAGVMEEQPERQPIESMVERPDLDALRESYRHPSRLRLRLERVIGVLRNRTLWTVILAVAIVAVLVLGYMQLT